MVSGKLAHYPPAMALSPRHTRRALAVIIVVTSLWWVQRGQRPEIALPPAALSTSPPTNPSPAAPHASPTVNQELRDAANPQRSRVQLFASGRVTRLLPDDNEGSRHQKFLIRATPDLSVLVVYNLDLARRVPVAVGDSVTVRGEYIWNDKGGLIHWTHRDPAQKHQPGWVDLKGTRYQ